MDTKKLFATFAILIIALSIAGFAYAHWEKIITISGTVDTGKLDLRIIDVSDSDDPTKPDPGKDKNVADTEIIIDPQDPERAIVTITNAYPSYYVYIHVTIRNVGTIPAKLKEIKITAPECIEVGAWDHIGEQLEPYPTKQYQSDYSGYIHVKQCAEQGATYTFTIEFIFWNWNEVP
jgi:hypothetical protein